MEKKIDVPAWKFQLKYSERMMKRCGADVDHVQKFETDLVASQAAIAKKMSEAKVSFAKNSMVDYENWDCDAMYPAPVKTDIGLPKWLGGVTDKAK